MSELNTRLFYLFALCLAFALPGLEWLDAANIGLLTSRGYEMPDGQMFYLLAKLLGMVAMSLAIVQIGFSLLGRSGVVRLHRDDHKTLGTLIAVLIVAHVAAFVTGVSLRGGHVAWHLLFPNLTSGSYNRGVGMGVFGLYFVILGTVLPILWRRLPRKVHRLAAAAVAFGMLHALWIGSEKTYLWTLFAIFGVLIVGSAVLQHKRAKTANAD